MERTTGVLERRMTRRDVGRELSRNDAILQRCKQFRFKPVEDLAGNVARCDPRPHETVRSRENDFEPRLS